MIHQPHIRLAKKTTAALLSFSLLWTSCNLSQAALEGSPVLSGALLPPQFNLVPPPQIGRVADYFNAAEPASGRAGEPAKLVILIQDLHAHYGVQKNIAALLEFLAGRLSRTGETEIKMCLRFPASPAHRLRRSPWPSKAPRARSILR